MKIAGGSSKPLDLLAGVLVEGARALGTPLRASCLFSDRAVAIIDVDAEFQPTVVEQIAGTSGGFELPVLITLSGLRGMSPGKITPGAPERLEPVN